MSAVLRDDRLLLPMTMQQLDAVHAIETAAYAFPWSRGNFIDSLAARYPAQVLYGSRGELLGYFIAMAGVDEMHLLNITVTPPAQGHGHGRFLLGELVRLCQRSRAEQLWLEVRESNSRARRMYQRFGFGEVGVRKNYYPAAHGQREHAVVMSLPLAPSLEGAGDALD